VSFVAPLATTMKNSHGAMRKKVVTTERHHPVVVVGHWQKSIEESD
jgi:hypothetical protein